MNLTELVKYLHVTAFILFKLTWIYSNQKGYFQSCTGLTVQLVKNIPNIVAIAKGHIDQVKNIRGQQSLYMKRTQRAQHSEKMVMSLI